MRKSYTPELADAMSKYWASFVKTGQPAGKVPWGPYTFGGIASAKQLHISTENNVPQITASVGLDHEKCDFFQKFIRGSGSDNDKYTNFCNFPAPLPSEYAVHAVIV